EQQLKANPASIALQSDLASNHAHIGKRQRELGQKSEALQQFMQSLQLRQKLMPSQPERRDWQQELGGLFSTIGALQRELNQYNAALESLQAALDIQRKLIAVDATQSQWQADLANTLGQLGLVQRQLGKPALTSFQSELALRLKLQNQYPDSAALKLELAQCYENLAQTRLDANQPQEALQQLLVAQSIWQKLLQNTPDSLALQKWLANHLSKLSPAYTRAGQLQAGRDTAQTELTMRQKLLAGEPKSPVRRYELVLAQTALADGELSLRNNAAALALFAQAQQGLQQLQAETPGSERFLLDSATLHKRVGKTLVAQNQHAAALEKYQQALAIEQKLADLKSNENDSRIQRDLAATLASQASIHSLLGQPDKAQTLLQRSISIVARLAAKQPDNPDWQTSLAAGYTRVGDSQLALGQAPQALASFNAALNYQQKVNAANPRDVTAQSEMMSLLIKLGDSQNSLGNPDAALDHFQSALPLLQQLIKDEPANPEWTRSEPALVMRIGNRQSEIRDFAAARNNLQNALKLRQALVKRFPDELALQFNVALNYASLGAMFQLQGQAKAALENWELAQNLCDLLVSSAPDNLEWKVASIVYGGKMASVDGSSFSTAQRLELLRSSVSQLKPMEQAKTLPAWGREFLTDFQEKIQVLSAPPSAPAANKPAATPVSNPATAPGK
ncbi:MAG: hypothetical protein RL748_263, partial [Pseudomonadota bacterium]